MYQKDEFSSEKSEVAILIFKFGISIIGICALLFLLVHGSNDEGPAELSGGENPARAIPPRIPPRNPTPNLVPMAFPGLRAENQKKKITQRSHGDFKK